MTYSITRCAAALLAAACFSACTPAAGAVAPGAGQGGTGAVSRPAQDRPHETVSVRDFGAKGDGITDDRAAIQRAHDACPSSTVHCVVLFPAGRYLLGTTLAFVNVTRSNVALVGARNAEIVTPGCDNPEVRTGPSYNTGLFITGTDVTVSLDMCGASVAFSPVLAAGPAPRLFVRNMRSRNLYYSAVGINSVAFDLVDIDGLTCETSRDMIDEVGNYACVSRTASSTDSPGNMIRVNRSLFRGVSGAIGAHNVRNVVIGGGTRFVGCDFACLKTAVASGYAEMNMSIDRSVTFDGRCVNPASANRHLACNTPASRPVNGYTQYVAVFATFNRIDFSAQVRDAPNLGVVFFDGVMHNARLTFDGARFVNVPAAIQDLQGSVSIVNSRFEGSNIVGTSTVGSLAQGNIRKLLIADNEFVESYIAPSLNTVAPGDRIDVVRNVFTYSRSDGGAIRFTNYGRDNQPAALVDANTITLSGGRKVAIDLGNRAQIGANNTLHGGAVINRPQAR